MTCGDTQISAGDLRNTIQKLSRVDPTKKSTGFEYQFKILEQVSPNPKEVNCATGKRHLDKNRGNKYLPCEFIHSLNTLCHPLPVFVFVSNMSCTASKYTSVLYSFARSLLPPAETSRVILKGEQPDYIHAVFAHVKIAGI